MSRRHLKVIFVALGTLILVYAAVQTLGPDDGRAGRRGPNLGGAVDADVSLIRISGSGAGGTVELAKTGDGWTVNGYPTDTALVRKAISGLDTVSVGRLVARTASNHHRLGVAEDSTLRVEIGPAADPALGFYLGGSGLEGRFVRFIGEDDVYVVAGESVGMLALGVDEWRNRLVVAVDTASLIRVVIRRSDEERETVLARSVAGPATSGWAEDGAVADTEAVRVLLEAAANLTADGFPSDSVAFAADFESPAATLEMYDSDEVGAPPVVSLLLLTAADARDFLVRRADDPLVYRLSALKAGQLLPSRSQLFPERQ